MELTWDLASFPLPLLSTAVLAARGCFPAVAAADDSTLKLFSDAGVLPSFPEKLKQKKRKCTLQHFVSQLNQFGISQDTGTSVT